MGNAQLVRFQSIVVEGHIAGKPRSRIYKCPICEERFRVYKRLKVHKQEVHAYGD